MNAKRVIAVIATALAALAMGVILTTPVSHAQPLGNGYDVTCTKANDGEVTCNVSGCPRVYEDLAGDVINTRIDGGPQSELSKACGNTTTQRVKASGDFTFSIQGCRKSTFGSDCGAWSDYRYIAPPPPVIAKPADVPPPPAQPQVKVCPDGSSIPIANDCPKKKPPTNAVSMNVGRSGLQVNVTVSNSSELAAQCTYDATEANGLGFPVSRQFSLAAKGSTTLNFPAPLIGQSYNLVAACSADFEGQQVEIGRATATA